LLETDISTEPAPTGFEKISSVGAGSG